MRIHFIGIGGIGVSALAKYYLEKGHQVSGSDLVSSEITEALKKRGAKIFIGPHKAKNLPKDVNLVIYSPAVPRNNPESEAVTSIQYPRLNNQPRVLSYPEALGELTKQHFTIAISGTHGKSTTTAMIGLILAKAGLDPTVIVGTKLKEFGQSNCRVGKSKYLVIEADEHFASFLNYWPKIIVLTSIDADHLDYYKNLKNILRAFKKYISHLPEDGYLIANQDDKNIIQIYSTIVKNVLKYSLKDKESKKLKEILKIPGEHNVANALAAINVARLLKILDKISFKVLSEYRGAWRRFELSHAELRRTKRRTTRKITIISDYGHHPTEIKVTLKAARQKYPKRKIWCVYQPHQYQRTYYLLDDFVEVLAQVPVNKLILTEIFDVAGREDKTIKKKVNSKKLVKIIKNKLEKSSLLCSSELSAQNVVYLPGNSDFKKIKEYLKKNLQGGEAVIIMGAGDIYKLAEQF